MAIGPILVILFLNGLVIAAILSILAMRARQPRVKTPSCGKCRYPVEGLTVMTCPECGGDLRQVGILIPRYSGGITRAMFIALWTLVLPVPAIIITFIVGSALPMDRTSGADMQIIPTSPGVQTMLLNLRSNSSKTFAAYDRGDLILVLGQGPASVASLDLSNRTFTPVDSDDTNDGAPLNETELTKWFANVSGSTHGECQNDATMVLEAIDSTSAGPVVVSTTTNNISTRTWTRSQPAVWYPPTALVFWIAVWVVGIVMIVRRFKRKALQESANAVVTTT